MSHEALARLQRIEAGESLKGVYGSCIGSIYSTRDCSNAANDRATLAAFVLAHPHLLAKADDTPITEEWLRSAGFREWEQDFDFDEGYDLWLPMQPELSWECRLAYVANGFYAVRMTDSDDEEHKGPCESVELLNSRNSKKVITRGAVRRLCSALGITLKEPDHAK